MRHTHEDGHKCDMCEHGMDWVLEKEKETLETYGWYGHIVRDCPLSPFGVNIHTHGIEEKFGHPDLQICFAIPDNVAMAILHVATALISEGTVFKPGNKCSEIIEGYDVQFIEARECGRTVIRLLLPDKDNEIKEFFAEQLENLDNEADNRIEENGGSLS